MAPASTIPYNETAPTGGNSLTQDLNVFYEPGDIAWMLTSAALVLLMIPGVGFFYAGLSRRKSALSVVFLTLVATAIVSVQWVVFGYSLTFSHTANFFMGNFENAGFRNVLGRPSVGSPRIPDLLFAVYQCMFAAITIAIATGAQAERGRILPMLVFILVWTTVIYDPIACWTWNPNGWVSKEGGLDFAGGTPVHISSGCAAFAYSIMLGRRKGYEGPGIFYRPHNVHLIVLGTVCLWVGWFGFNGGSAMSANLRACVAIVNTFTASSTAGITWCLMDHYTGPKRQWSVVGFCTGIVVGLVAITPGSGFVPVWSSPIFGVCAGIISCLATRLPAILTVDDALDVFAVHAVSGFVGNILTGVFAADYIAHLDGFTKIDGGWLNGHWIQVAYQLADSVAGAAYSFFGSLIILCIMDKIPDLGLKLNVSNEAEISGVDEAELGQVSYDYVEYHSDVEALSGLKQLKDDFANMQRSLAQLANGLGTGAESTPRNSFGKDSARHGTMSKESTANGSISNESIGVGPSFQDHPTLRIQNSNQGMSTVHGSSTRPSTNQSSLKTSNESSVPSTNAPQHELTQVPSSNHSNYQHGEHLIHSVSNGLPSASSSYAVPRPALRSQGSNLG